MEGGLVHLVDHFGLWLPSFLRNRGPFLLPWGSKCESLPGGPAKDLHFYLCFCFFSFSGASLAQSLDSLLGELFWFFVNGKPSCKAWTWLLSQFGNFIGPQTLPWLEDMLCVKLTASSGSHLSFTRLWACCQLICCQTKWRQGNKMIIRKGLRNVANEIN